MRRRPARSSSPNRDDATPRLLGRARITTCSELIQICHHVAGDMAQPSGQAVPLHGGPDRSRDNQSEFGIADGMPHIDDHVRLDGSLSVLDRRIEIGRPRHAVTRGKHRRHTGIEGSGSQRATALAAPARHDRPAGPGSHPQPETVHAGTAPVVRLERPLALCHDSLLAASGRRARHGFPCRWVTLSPTTPR